jgi:hypothetical protein
LRISIASFILLVFLIFIPAATSIPWIDIPYEARNIFEAQETIWILTASQGIYLTAKSDGGQTHLVAPANLPSNRTSCGAVALGEVWLGTENGLYHSESSRLDWKRVEEGVLPSEQVNCMARMRDELWVGTRKGVARLDSDGAWTVYDQNDGLSGGWVMAMEADRDRILIGTMRGGVSEYYASSGLWRSWRTEDGLISNSVFSLSSSDRRIFVGTTSGLSIIEPETSSITNYGSRLLPSPVVFSTAWCPEIGQAWIGTGSGIAIWEDGRNMTVVDKVGEIALGKINALLEIDGVIWALRQNTDWFSHDTSGVIGYDTRERSWLKPVIIDVLIDQSGYGPGFPKRFLVQSNEPLQAQGLFTVISAAGREVYSGVLGPRIDREDWDAYYWSGDFTDLRTRGNFSIHVAFNSLESDSYRFEIDNDVLIDECGELIYEFLTYMRCGVSHEYRSSPCHLDDGVLLNGTHVNATGGWHCAGLWAGKYSEYHSYVLFNLLFARDVRPIYFDAIDRDGDNLPDIINEAMWGCEFLLKMQESNGSIHHEVEKVEKTDGVIGTPDDRKLMGWMGNRDGLLAVAGLAGTAALIEDHYPEDADRFVEGALRSFDLFGGRVLESVGNSLEAAAMMTACSQLYRATGNETYLELAEEFCNLTLNMRYRAFRGPFIPVALGYYSTVLNPATEFGDEIIGYVVGHAEDRLASDTGPGSGLYPFEIPTFRLYLMDPEAAAVLFAYRFSDNETHLKYGLGLVDNHLGVNPYGICMLEGTGTHNSPGYASHFTKPANPRGAVPGSIPQGIEMKKGRPYYDTSISPHWPSGETWLINTNFLQSIVLVPEDEREYPLEVKETRASLAIPVLGLLGLVLVGTRPRTAS